MKEGRPVLLAFGGIAALMIAVPVATVLTTTRPGAPDQGLDGEISKVFLAEDAHGPATASPQPVARVGQLLPKGTSETVVFEKLTASGFTCATDSDAATCFRSRARAPCKDDWTIRLIFSDNGTVWSTKAQRQAAC